MKKNETFLGRMEAFLWDVQIFNVFRSGHDCGDEEAMCLGETDSKTRKDRLLIGWSYQDFTAKKDLGFANVNGRRRRRWNLCLYGVNFVVNQYLLTQRY